ncbi:MAG: DUF3667 domain-containing protein [Bacteroidota bacterium]
MSKQPERISIPRLWNSFLEVLNLEKGFLLTIKDLAVRPGKMMRSYLFTEKRFDYAKPFSFLVLLTAIGTFLTAKILAYSQGQTEEQVQQFPEAMQDSVQRAMDLLGEYYNLYQVSQIPIYALATYWLFKSIRYNYAEHLIINCFLTAFSALIFILVFPLFFISPSLMSALLVVIFVYQVYFYQSIFQEKLLFTIGKAFLTYFIVSALHGLLIMSSLFAYFYLFEA